MLEINLKKLIKNYDQNLLDNLRGFGKDDEFLKFWVPGTSDFQSFLNLLDALVETKIFYVRIIIETTNGKKKFIEKVETFLPKISSFIKNIDENSIHLIIEIDKTKYQNYIINKRNQNKTAKELEIDRTKHVTAYKVDELIRPLYKKNLDLFHPKDFYSNIGTTNKELFVQKIEDIELVFEIKDRVIKNIFHNIEENSNVKKLTDIFFELILNKNIQEASDHGAIYLEEKIRLGNNKMASQGIILPGQAGSYFVSLNNAIRSVFLNYKLKNNIEFDINKNYFEISSRWKKLDNKEKTKQIDNVLKEICRNNNFLSQESVSINKIENDFKIYLKVDDNFRKIQQEKNILLDIEIKLKKLEDTLEVFVDEILDQNKLRLKNSPQNI
ncbi:hypothetical protein OAM83_03170 [Candidatus Pelagibacter sp.]|nr:hypothetical protein [Candidatus Pelagibacter sp.]